MSSDLETLAYVAITHGQPLGDEEVRLIDPTWNELVEELRADRTKLSSAFLAGFTPHVTIENPFLSLTYTILKRHWKGIIKLYPTPPVWLLRYVLATALIRLLEQDTIIASVAALTLGDLHDHLNDTTERDLRTKILAQVRPQFERAATAAWAAESTPDLPASKKVELTLPSDATANIKTALKKALTPPTGENYPPSAEWIEAVAEGVSRQIIQTVQSALQATSSKLPNQIKTAEQYHNEIQSILSRAEINERREALMWWLQTKYSDTQDASYRTFPPVVGALHMTRDFVALTEGLVPRSVAAVLSEAILATYGAEATVQRSLDDLLLEWAPYTSELSSDSDAPMPLDAALSTLAKNAELTPTSLLGVDKDATVTLLTATAWLLDASMLRRLEA